LAEGERGPEGVNPAAVIKKTKKDRSGCGDNGEEKTWGGQLNSLGTWIDAEEKSGRNETQEEGKQT